VSEDEPVPVVPVVLEPVPIDPDPVLEPLCVDVPVELVPEPVVPPLVEPVWANAAPAASIETTANRFHHVFRMRKRSR
jgi:hypothetical protein